MKIVDWVKVYQINDDHERIYRLEGKKDGIKDEKLKIAKICLKLVKMKFKF